MTVPCFAKLNLDLRVFGKRPDGYHELRTIFQTISLKDTLEIDFRFAKRTQIDLSSSVEIKDNLVVRAAEAVLNSLKIQASIRFVLEKRIPMGAGLGGGSSDAAAVLLAIPALAGKEIARAELVRLAETLGSDVPFFLEGGTALGVGRGTELYPLPEPAARAAVVVWTGISVSTAEAYRMLQRSPQDALTSTAESPILREFQTIAWTLDGSSLEELPFKNDFEGPVLKLHEELAVLVRKLKKLGAKPALMTGSGSAVFGIFKNAAEARRAAAQFGLGQAWAVQFISRRQYSREWQSALAAASGSAAERKERR